MKPSRILLLLGALLILYGVCDIGYRWHSAVLSERQNAAQQGKQRRERVVEIEQAQRITEAEQKGIIMDYQINGAGSTEVNVVVPFISGTGYTRLWQNGDVSMFAEPFDHWKIEYNSTVMYENFADGEGNPPESGWAAVSGDAPAPTVTVAGGTGPVPDSAIIDATGLTLTLEWTMTGDIQGAFGMQLGNLSESANLVHSLNSGTVSVFNLSRTMYSGETPLLNYFPGDFEDDSDNAVAAFNDFPITNNSTQTAPAPTGSGNFLMVF